MNKRLGRWKDRIVSISHDQPSTMVKKASFKLTRIMPCVWTITQKLKGVHHKKHIGVWTVQGSLLEFYLDSTLIKKINQIDGFQKPCNFNVVRIGTSDGTDVIPFHVTPILVWPFSATGLTRPLDFSCLIRVVIATKVCLIRTLNLACSIRSICEN